MRRPLDDDRLERSSSASTSRSSSTRCCSTSSAPQAASVALVGSALSRVSAVSADVGETGSNKVESPGRTDNTHQKEEGTPRRAFLLPGSTQAARRPDRSRAGGEPGAPWIPALDRNTRMRERHLARRPRWQDLRVSGRDAVKDGAYRRGPPARAAVRGRCAGGVHARAICARLWPASRFARISSTSSGETAAGRPGLPDGCACSRAGRRRSAISRSSSSTGISRVPHGISTVSISGSTRRLKVDLPKPSASAAWRRV